MCDPVSIGVGLQAFGTYQQGAAAASKASYDAKVADQNAALSIQQGNDIQRQKAEEQTIMLQQAREAKGRQMAAMAGAGIDSSTGSGLDILSDSAYTTQQDINQSDYNAARKQWGYQQQAENYKAEASANRAAAKNAKTAGIIGAASQLATIGSVSDKWQSKGTGNAQITKPASDFFPSTDWQNNNFSFNNSLLPKTKVKTYGVNYHHL